MAQELYTVEDNLIIVQGWPGVAKLNRDHQLFLKESPIDLNLIKLYIISEQLSAASEKAGPNPSREAIERLTEQERNLPTEFFNQLQTLSNMLPQVEALNRGNTPPFFHGKKIMFFNLNLDNSILRLNI